MRVRGKLASVGAVVIAAWAVFACTDLFHSTDDIKNACDLDSGACDEICASDHGAALARAKNACVWLGSCATPAGDNQFGACVFQALLAYDCDANPNRKVKGKTRAFWDCMSKVASCGDVSACTFPDNASACGTSAARQGCGGSPYEDTRILCPGADGGVGIESCAAWGQTCATTSATTSVCAANEEATTCVGVARCEGTLLVGCAGAAGAPHDLGVDCANYGAGQCKKSQSGVVACVAENGAVCTPSTAPSASCNGDVATACVSGVTETLDCGTLTGPHTCNQEPLAPSWSLASGS
jgi:hypothetical protein